MAGAARRDCARRDYGEDGIYFDHVATAGTVSFIRPALRHQAQARAASGSLWWSPIQEAQLPGPGDRLAA